MKFELGSFRSKRLINLVLVLIAIMAIGVLWSTRHPSSTQALALDTPVVRAEPRSGVITNAASDHLSIQTPGSKTGEVVPISPRTTVRVLKQDGTFEEASQTALVNGAYIVVTVDGNGATYAAWSIDVMPRFRGASS